MRISDWSSDVCSSDLLGGGAKAGAHVDAFGAQRQRRDEAAPVADAARSEHRDFHLVSSRGDQDQARNIVLAGVSGEDDIPRSEEHTSELQSLMRISYAVFCLKKKKNRIKHRLMS